MLATTNTTTGSAAVQGNRTYDPYGHQRYQQGSLGTAKGFTGQYNDTLTGLDYYGARYYDQKAGVFLSADSVQGNLQGMNPYGYVNGNPETFADPTGQRVVGGGLGGPGDAGGGSSGESSGSSGVSVPPPFGGSGWAPPVAPVLSSGQGEASSGSGSKWYSKGSSITTVEQKPSNFDSCGIGNQALCSHTLANYAIYFGPFQIGVPGIWNLDSGSGGGGDSGGGDRSGNDGAAASGEFVPSAEIATADPEYPAPQSVLDAAVDTAILSNNIGGKTEWTTGSVVITDVNGNYLGGAGPFKGRGLPNTHVEIEMLSATVKWIKREIDPGQSIAVHFVTENQACGACYNMFENGEWQETLQRASNDVEGGNVGLFDWWHYKDGRVLLWFPSTFSR